MMGEIRMWADKIKHEPQFEDIVLCDTKVKGRDGDLRVEVELQGSKKRAGIGLSILKKNKRDRKIQWWLSKVKLDLKQTI